MQSKTKRDAPINRAALSPIWWLFFLSGYTALICVGVYLLIAPLPSSNVWLAWTLLFVSVSFMSLHLWALRGERERMERLIVDHTTRLKLFFEYAPVAVAMFDREMRYIQASKRWNEVFSLGDIALEGKNHYDVFPEVGATWRDIHARGMLGEVIREEEDRFVRANGDDQWLRWEVRPWYDANGDIGGIVIFSEDVTERKEAEQVIVERDAMLRRVGEVAKVGASILDLRSKEMYWSPELCRIHELSEDFTPTFEQCVEFYPPESRALMVPVIDALIENATPFELELQINTAKGHRVWVNMQASAIVEEGKVVKMLAAYQDITARKQAEIQLRESEQRFREIAENIHEVFWVFDMALQRVVYISPAYEKIWGRSISDALSNHHTWIDAIVSEDRDRVSNAIGRLENGRYDATYRISRPDGTIRWIRDQGYAVLDEQGAVSRLVGTAEDVTEAREAENRLRQAQRLDSIGTLTGGIAHDFNNILSGILGFSAMAEQLVDQGEINRVELKSTLSNINRAGHRATDLVAQILTFSRAGTIDYARVRLDQVASEAIKLLRAAIPSYIEFETHVPDHLPTIMGNASQLHQVVMNLCTNAWQAMRDKKGRLLVSLDVCSIDEAQARLLSNVVPGQFVRLTVKDTGMGMSADTIERIFEPFFTTKPSGQGTGLGLSVVHGIVRSHHGTIKVSSELNKGTTVEVLLPVSVESSNRVESTASAQTQIRGDGQRVLFIDDEPALVHLGERALGRLGFQVTGVHSAVVALEMLEQSPNQFDLIVTDQTMPGMTGLEFATRVRQLCPMPVVLVSGYMAGITQEQLRAAGICEAINKPYSNDLLAAIIYKQLAGKQR